MIMTKKQVREITKILDDTSDDELVHSLITLRTMIVLGAAKPIKRAMFSQEILTHEVFRRGIEL